MGNPIRNLLINPRWKCRRPLLIGVWKGRRLTDYRVLEKKVFPYALFEQLILNRLVSALLGFSWPRETACRSFQR